MGSFGVGSFMRLIGLVISGLTLANCATDSTANRTDLNSIAMTTAAKLEHDHQRKVRNADSAAIVGRRPAECPRSFCGCEASRYLFGHVRSDLNLASNWARKFPRVAPAPGMAAVRNHHVFVLMSHVGGTNWLVHDGNSGHGLTREHVRSISGYVVVNPRSTETTAPIVAQANAE